MNKISILIVDDVATTRDLLRGMVSNLMVPPLCDLSVTIYQTASSTETARLLEETQVDLVLLDIGLPDGSGLDLIDMLREKNNSIAIVIVSGDSSASSVKTAIAMGVDGFIVKPFNKARVKEALENSIKKITTC